MSPCYFISSCVQIAQAINSFIDCEIAYYKMSYVRMSSQDRPEPVPYGASDTLLRSLSKEIESLASQYVGGTSNTTDSRRKKIGDNVHRHELLKAKERSALARELESLRDLVDDLLIISEVRRGLMPLYTSAALSIQSRRTPPWGHYQRVLSRLTADGVEVESKHIGMRNLRRNVLSECAVLESLSAAFAAVASYRFRECMLHLALIRQRLAEMYWAGVGTPADAGASNIGMIVPAAQTNPSRQGQGQRDRIEEADEEEDEEIMLSSSRVRSTSTTGQTHKDHKQRAPVYLEWFHRCSRFLLGKASFYFYQVSRCSFREREGVL